MTQTVLIVEDDPKIMALLRNVLEDEGFVVWDAVSSAQALTAVNTRGIDLITLDLNLGSESGLELARKVREHSDIPIIMITGKDDVIDRVVGLELGADDYITKPFHVREVVARVRTVLRRSAQGDAQNAASDTASTAESLQYRFDGLTVVPDCLELRDRKGAQSPMTSGDFRLLSVFLERPKRVLSRDQLMSLTGGHEWNPMDRTIDNQIARLRKKIERDPSDPKLIKTVRGIGYIFASEVQKVPSPDGSRQSA